MLSLPPPDFGEDAADAIQGDNAACGLTPTAAASEEALPADQAQEAPLADLALAICEAPASGEDPSDDSVPAEASSEEPRRRVAFKALEIAAQIHQVQEWLTEGKRPNEIRRLCCDEWGLSTRVSETRMADARRQMVLDVNTYDRKEMAAKMIQSLDTVLNQALEMHQGSNAIGAMRLQADLLQLLSRQN